MMQKNKKQCICVGIIGFLILMSVIFYPFSHNTPLNEQFEKPVLEGLIISNLYNPSKDSLSFEMISGGRTDALTYKILVNDQPYFLKIFDPKSDSHINQTSIKLTQYADEHRIGPKFYYAPEDKSFMITEFFKGHPLTLEEAHDSELIIKVAKALKIIHTYPTKDIQYSIYLNKIKNRINELIKKSAEFEPAFNAAYRDAAKLSYLVNLRSPLSLTHGDFHNGNFFYDGENRIAIFDWDDAGILNPYIDIALFFKENNYSTTQKIFFLEAYFEHPPSKKELAIMTLSEQIILYYRAIKKYQTYLHSNNERKKEEALRLLNQFNKNLKSEKIQKAINKIDP